MNNNLVRVIVFEKGNLEHFLINHNIYYSHLIKTNDYYILTISFHNYNIIKRRFKCTIIRQYGINFIKDFFNIHKYMIVSFFVGMLMLYMLCNTIFDIKININNENIKNILNYSLYRNGIAIHKKKKSFYEIERIKKEILKENKDTLEWIEISEDGCNYIVDVTPRIKKENNINEEYVSDIVAKKDGKILFITAKSGISLKEKNDYVKKGEVLITGNISKDDKLVYQVKSEGKVYAEVWYTTQVTIPFKYIEQVNFEKPIYRYYLVAFNQEFTILGKYNDNNVKKSKKLLIDKPYLPFKIYQERIQRYKYNEKYISQEDAYQKAIKKSDNEIKNKLNDGEYIISKKVLKKEVFSSKIIIEIFYKVYENIAESSEILKRNE